MELERMPLFELPDLPDGTLPIELPELALVDHKRTIKRTYADGTVVETKMDSSNQPVEVTIRYADASSIVYTKTEGPDGEDLWQGVTNVGTDAGGLPEGAFYARTGEYRLADETFDDPGNARLDYVLEDDPLDDATVTDVTVAPLPEDHDVRGGDASKYQAFTVTLSDRTEVLVLVEISAIPEGETAVSIAELYGERMGKLPPEVRAKITPRINYVLADDLLSGRAAVFNHGDLGIGVDVNVNVLMNDSDGAFQTTLLHETGHLVDDKDNDEWRAAMEADQGSPSVCAGSSINEDYAETFLIWYQVRSGQITGAEAAALEAEFGERFALLDQSPEALESLPGATDGTLATTKIFENGDVIETRHEQQSDGSWETTFVRVTRENDMVLTYTRHDDTDDFDWTRTSGVPGEPEVTVPVSSVPDDYFVGDPEHN